MRANSSTARVIALHLATIAAAVLPPAAGAQTVTPQGQGPAESSPPARGKDGETVEATARKKKPKKDVVRLTEWPKPADKAAVALDIERLCKARTPEMAVQAREALEAAGEATVPFLLERLGKERDESATKRVREVLITNTNATHTRLLAKEFESRMQTTRTFVLWRCAAFPDPQIRPAAEQAWARLGKLGDKADPDELYAAALCAASTGSIAGLEVLHAAANKNWDRRGGEIRAAVEGARGPEATKFEIGKLANADQRQKVAVLHMLAGCGDSSALPSIRRYLDDDDNQIRVASINACRGILDGDPPLEQLPVFEAIEIAKKCKARL